MTITMPTMIEETMIAGVGYQNRFVLSFIQAIDMPDSNKKLIESTSSTLTVGLPRVGTQKAPR